MIGYLRGELRQLTPGVALVDVGGVGYELHIPLSTFSELERSAGKTVELHVHTHVRDDAILLYGFARDRERRLFERLIAVSGIGPRLAQAVLSGMAASELVATLAAGDEKRLGRIPGVGKKTAARMVVELRDKIGELAGGSDVAAGPAAEDDLVSALVNLGYKPADADRALAAVRKEQPELESSEQLRAALRRLSRV